MSKKLFPNGRKVIKVYVGKIDHEHIEKKAGGKGKVSEWVRKLIWDKMGWGK